MSGVDRQHVEQYAEAGRNAFTRSVCRQLLATLDELREEKESHAATWRRAADNGAALIEARIENERLRLEIDTMEIGS